MNEQFGPRLVRAAEIGVQAGALLLLLAALVLDLWPSRSELNHAIAVLVAVRAATAFFHGRQWGRRHPAPVRA